MTRVPLFALVLALCPALAQLQPVETSSSRGTVCLNGAWRFQPAVGPAAGAPSGDWGEALVPGSWSGTQCLPGLAKTSQAAPWDAVPVAQASRAWYERQVNVPASWQGRAIVLELTRVSTDARVYCNGTDCGLINWPSGTVDITPAVRFGQDNLLRILVVAAPQAQNVAAALAGDQPSWRLPGNVDARGIVGEALLHSRPAGAHADGLTIATSVREHRLSVRLGLAGVSQAGAARFTARLLGPDGRAEKTFTASAPLNAGQTRVDLAWPWPDPRLWDIDQPNLYRLMLAVEAPGWRDEVTETIGFREFRIDRLRFLLNEREIRLRPVTARDEWNYCAWVPQAIDNTLDGYRAAGFNLAEAWPGDENARGTVYLRYLWAEAADRKGLLLAGAAPAAGPLIYDSGFAWSRPGQKERYNALLTQQLGRLRNHPSIVMWATSGNLFGRQQDQNPVVIGRRGWYQRGDLAKAGDEVVAAIKREDPTRPVFTHHGADVGDVHTCNNYLDLIPLQEREEWLSEYVTKAQMPFLPIEFGTPLHTTFMRGRNGFGEAVVSEPLMTEFCAIYLGERAYDTEPAAYRARLVSDYEGPDRWRNWHGATALEQAPAFQAVEELFIRNTWRSWRTWGLTAGMVPWNMGHGWSLPDDKRWAQTPITPRPDGRGVWMANANLADVHYLQPAGNWSAAPAGQALIANNNTTLAYIAGSAERFTAKDHHYESGATVAKQAILINDLRQAVPYSLHWRLTVGGKVQAEQKETGRIDPAATLRKPVSGKLPAVTSVTDGQIELDVTIGEAKHTDRMAFRVYPPFAPRPGGTIWIHDPRGETTRLLAEAGYQTRAWTGRPAPGQVLVIGRRALEAALPGSPAEHVAAGGRLVLMGQTPACLRDQLGLRTAGHVSRRFWPVPTQSRHPIVDGLDAEDLRDWNGSGTLVPTTWGGLDESPNADPALGWHWGNYGSVASAAVEKPHLAGWRPLLHGEFDMAYSPLLELQHGEGLALLCTLDLEARTSAEPMARRLARRLVEYARSAQPEPRVKRCVYLGGAPGRQLLRGLGLRFEAADNLPAADRSTLAVVAADAKVAETDLSAFAAAGGRVLLLPRANALLGTMGQTAAYHDAGELPDWPELRGLSRSDLRLRADQPLRPLLAGGGVAPTAGGLLGRAHDGRVLALQLTPDMLPAGEKTYLRYSRWRLTRALTQLLANLGAEFAMDARSLSPGWNATARPIGLAGAWRFRVERKLPAASSVDRRTEDPGQDAATTGWSAEKLDLTGWSTFTLPAMWETAPGVGEADGSFWVRREVTVPEAWLGRELLLKLGPVDDRDVTWFNGVKVGAASGWNVPRTYTIPARLVKAGVNSIAIRVFDEFGGGGWSCRAEDMMLGPVTPAVLPEGEILTNTTFAEGTQGWSLGVQGTAAATMAVSDDVPPELLGQKSLRIDITKTSDTGWHVQLGHPGFGLQAGVAYVWSAWLRASAPAGVTCAIEKDHDPWGSAGLFERTTLGPQWKHVKLTFRAGQADAKTRFTLQELAGQAVTLWMAAPSFTVVPDPGTRPAVLDPTGFYHPDYVEGQALGDDPYRYYRW
ncbi:MAG: carbohydrate binding domain-containing protein [Armatimonadetes bacterium]|nr:carbohydrate binding domain-containing protein [Armatimonadota bacterium]